MVLRKGIIIRLHLVERKRLPGQPTNATGQPIIHVSMVWVPHAHFCAIGKDIPCAFEYCARSFSTYGSRDEFSKSRVGAVPRFACWVHGLHRQDVPFRISFLLPERLRFLASLQRRQGDPGRSGPAPTKRVQTCESVSGLLGRPRTRIDGFC